MDPCLRRGDGERMIGMSCAYSFNPAVSAFAKAALAL